MYALAREIQVAGLVAFLGFRLAATALSIAFRASDTALDCALAKVTEKTSAIANKTFFIVIKIKIVFIVVNCSLMLAVGRFANYF
jgi:hypothetical protein